MVPIRTYVAAMVGTIVGALVRAKYLSPLTNIKFIILPFGRITFDIFGDILVRLFVSNDMFVVVALPNVLNVGVLPHPFGNANFKTA